MVAVVLAVAGPADDFVGTGQLHKQELADTAVEVLVRELHV